MMLMLPMAFILSMGTLNANDLIKVELVGNNTCNGQLEMGIWVRASAFATSDFEIGTSSLFFNFDPAVVTFNSYTSGQFDTNTLQGANSNWEDQRTDVHPDCGLLSIVLYKKGGGTNNYTLKKDAPILVGKVLFDFVGADADPSILLNSSFTNFNSPGTNDGTEGKILEDFPRLTSFDCCTNGASAATSLKVLLEGPYNASTLLMKDDLRDQGNLPSTDPYIALGYDYVNSNTNGIITDPTTVFLDFGSNAIIDWIFVKVFHLDDPNRILFAQPALLQRDGDVVELDGSTPVRLGHFNSCTFGVAVYHRNHLGVQTTANGVTFTNANTGTLDLSDGTHQLEGDIKVSGNNKAVLYAGDAAYDNTVDSGDRSNIWNDRNQSGYLSSDINMDGVCDSSDRSRVWNNRNKIGITVP